MNDGHNNWVIQNTQYFDAGTGAWIRADIEIAGSRIARIRSPNRSTLGSTVRGDTFVCTPGFVSIDASEFPDADINGASNGGIGEEYTHDPGSAESGRISVALARAMLSGYTTFGLFADTPASAAKIVERIGARAVLHLTCSDRWLGEGEGPRRRSWDEFISNHLGQYGTVESDTLSIGLGIASQLCVSPELTVQLHRFAKARARRFVARVDDGYPFASNFMDAYGCSGIRLLENLGVLDDSTTLILEGRVGRAEVESIRRSGAMIARSLPRHPRLDGFEGGALGSARGAPGALARTPADSARLIGQLTRANALALGLRDVGSIAPGMSADIQLHRQRADDDGRATRGDALVLGDRPVHVLTNGRWTVRNHACCLPLATTLATRGLLGRIVPGPHGELPSQQA